MGDGEEGEIWKLQEESGGAAEEEGVGLIPSGPEHSDAAGILASILAGSANHMSRLVSPQVQVGP